MTTGLNIGARGVSRKQTVAELNDLAVVLPMARTISHRGTKVNNHGIPAPGGRLKTSLVSGSLSGTFLIAAALYDPDYDARGAVCSVQSVTITNKAIKYFTQSLTGLLSNTRVKQIIFYRTLAGGSVLFENGYQSLTGGSITSTAVVLTRNQSDAFISANDTAKIGTQAPRVIPADKYGAIKRHGQRLFARAPADYYGKMYTSSAAARAWGQGSITANRAIWGEADSADAFPSDNAVNIGPSVPLRALAPLGDALAVFNDFQTFLWIYRDDPDGNTGDGSIQDMFTGRGAVTDKAAINVDGKLFVMDRRGWYEYGGGQATLDITDDIRPMLDRINWGEVAQISGAYDDQRIMWFVPLDGDTECKHALVIDRVAYQANQGAYWWLYYFPMGVRDADSYVIGRDNFSRTRGIDGTRRIRIITTDGVEMDITPGSYRDGVHPSWDAEGYTSAAAAKTFRKRGGGTFKTSNIDVRGLYVKFDNDRTPDPLLIASATTTTFTLNTSLTTNLTQSTAYTIGGIKAYWKSPQMDMGDPMAKKTGYGIVLRYKPTGLNNRFRVRMEADRRGPEINMVSTTQTGWRATRLKDFVQVDTGGKYASNGRTGLVELPVHTRSWNELQVEVGSSNVDNPWRVAGMLVRHNSTKQNR